jgi:LCP family protein required for cell wall assembly
LRAIVALVVMTLVMVGGYGWSAYRDLSTGMTHSRALQGLRSFPPRPHSESGAQEPDPSQGEASSTNILIMGLDSRLDQNGDPLPAPVLAQLHAGDSRDGGYNTNVLMVLHMPAGGGRVQAISIPRDDYVALPGTPGGKDQAKIKEGYGLAKVDAERRLRAEGVTDRKKLERQGREAGRRQTIEDVEDFLNIPIDHFVEITLAGFYDLTDALGSVTVCLTGPTQDSYSGARFVAGRQQLNAAQAVAFVRQRRDYIHPQLNFTDLDRERRQQAFLASAAYQLKSVGTFANPARLAALIDMAQKDVVIDETFDPLKFVVEHPDLIDGQVTFTTLPVIKFATVRGQAVNIVDKQRNQAVVHQLFDRGPTPDAAIPDAAFPDAAAPGVAGPDVPRPPSLASTATTLDVVNAAGRAGLGARVSAALETHGFSRGAVRIQHDRAAHSNLAYAPGSLAMASALATLLDQPAPQVDPGLAPGHIRLTLGQDFQFADPGPAAATDAGTGPDNSTAPAHDSATQGDDPKEADGPADARAEGGGPATDDPATDPNDAGSEGDGSGPRAAAPASSISAGGIPCVK